MKLRKTLPLILLGLISLAASAQDNYLVPKSYYLHKGSKLEVYLVAGEQFKDVDEYKYDASKTTKFMLYDDGKKINLMTAAKDSASPVVNTIANNSGMIMVEMTRKIPPTPIEHDTYAKYLNDEGLVKLAETVTNSNQSSFREKKVCYMKTLVMVDKASGDDYDKPLGQEFEIVLKKNPYKLNYGDDLTGVLYYKGKPLKDASIDLLLKTEKGNVYPDRVTTDAKGEFSLTVTREGVYLIRSVRTVASTSNDADFETIQAAYTFLFNSANTRTSDFKSFGLSDRN
ncbi:DUF4198 domain-containing protein [Mucilaginibacter boryungensis]|uniref:DUF4198 domain-containing protein n=1 Tax=Mucilaginibacter boryungensis TaxID=768480 RepID=A0ABR9XMI5_9SPHI|nr:DUF4198 domain-containing protein [Mucilaginibacter boryungensis]MBE9668465.1 DUF4198 domain-containing protein [Mucilaginibacter boryungensis]